MGLALASLHPSASPIWPPTGLALAAVMLRGPRVWPAILIAAGLANLTNAGSLFTSLALAVGNTAESLIGGYLIGRFSGGLRTFETPAGVARFALIALLPRPGQREHRVGSLAVAGYVDPAQIASTWMTWWLGDLAGALVITPVFVLWAGTAGHPAPPASGSRAASCSRARSRSDCSRSARCSSSRQPRSVGLSGRAAADVGGVAPGAAGHRDRGARALGLRDLGHGRGRGAVARARR